MKLSEADRLLSATPIPLELGYERLPDGVLHVACRTDLHGCTGEMFEWWFRFRPDTQKYIWWHPVDHVFSDWIEGRPGTHVGSIHVVEEFFTGLPSEKLSIQFRDANEFFDPAAYRKARETKAISAAVCARISATHSPPRREDGAVLGGRLLHVGRDTPWGCALRSHFYLGQDLPALGKSPAEIAAIFTDEFGRALLQHCYNEFVFLSRFLPSLYIAENRTQVKVQVPW
jgi:DAPG hydrolase PhiG domain